MAHIEKRARDRWRARWQGPDGKLRSRTFTRHHDAERWLHEVEVAKVRGDYVDPALGKKRLDAWAWSWLDTVRPALKESTVAGYESLLRSRILPTLGTYRLGELRPSDVQTWLGELEAAGLSASRIRKAHVVLSMALDAAVRDQLIARNAAHRAKLPRVPRREAAYFEPAVVDQMAAAMPAQYDLLVRVLGVLGLRFGEAAALERRSVDLLRRRLRIEASLSEVSGRLVRSTTKTHAERSVPLPPSLVAAFTQHLEIAVGSRAGASLFTGPKGGLLRHSAFYNRLWRPTLRELGLPAVGVHVLRHSAAARLISAGASPKAVQTIMGHSSAAFTLTVYGHMFETDLDTLAGRLDDDIALRAENLSPPQDPPTVLPPARTAREQAS